MALSTTDRQKLEQAFNVIRENEEKAEDLIKGVENKSWALVERILQEALDWLGYTINAVFNIAEAAAELLDELLDW